MNEDLLPSPIVAESASVAAASSGFELKDQWIGKVLNEVQRGNEAIEQQQGESLSLNVQA